MKTPGASPLKTRLAETVGREEAERFYSLSIAAVEAVAIDARRFAVEPYWAIAEQDQADHPLWNRFERLVQPSGGLGSRPSEIYRRLLERHAIALLIGADAPQLQPDTLREAAERLGAGGEPKFVLGPSRDGGFYLFGGRTPVPQEAWTSIEYSRSTTAEALSERLRPLGRIERLPPLSDVDTASDLAWAARDLRSLGEDASETQQAILRWIEDRPPRERSRTSSGRVGPSE